MKVSKTEQATTHKEDDIDESRLDLHKELSTIRVANKKTCSDDYRTWLDGPTDNDPFPAYVPSEEESEQEAANKL
jgi:hypothetical protein